MSDKFRSIYTIKNPYRGDIAVHLTDTELKDLKEKRPKILILPGRPCENVSGGDE